MLIFFLFLGGKKDEVQILALNDSISGTLSTDHLCAKTSVAISPHFTEDIFWLNGESQPITSNKRMTKCIEQSNLPFCLIFFLYFEVVN